MTSTPGEPDSEPFYILEEVVVLASSAERKVLFYCRKGLLEPARAGEDPCFDAEALVRLRRIESLRQRHGMNWAAIVMIMSLHAEVETLRRELRFLR